MSKRLITAIHAFEEKHNNLKDLVIKFSTYSSDVKRAMEDSTMSLKSLRERLAGWFVIFCFLNDESMYLVTGDISSGRHDNDRKRFEHTRAAGREIHKGDWLSLCSSDGINYETNQLDDRVRDSDKMETALNKCDGVMNEFQTGTEKRLKSQFQSCVANLSAVGATSVKSSMEHGVERLVFRLQQGQQVLNFDAARKDVIRNLSLDSVLKVLQPARSRPSKTIIVDSDEEEEDGYAKPAKKSECSVATVAARCSKDSKVSRVLESGDESEYTESVKAIKIDVLGADQVRQVSRSHHDLAMESYMKNPAAAHYRSDARGAREAREKIEREEAAKKEAAAAAALRSVSQSRETGGLSGGKSKSVGGHETQKAPGNGGSIGNGGVDQNSDGGVEGGGDEAFASEEWWQGQVKRRASATYQLPRPSTIVVRGTIHIDEGKERPFSVEIHWHGPPETMVFVDVLFEDITNQFWSDSSTIEPAFPRVLSIVNPKNNEQESMCAGDLCTISRLGEPDSVITIACEQSSSHRLALSLIKERWLERDAHQLSIPPSYGVLSLVCDCITRSSDCTENSEVCLDPSGEGISITVMRQYLRVIIEVVSKVIASTDSPLPKIILRNISWTLKRDELCALFATASSLRFEKCSLSSLGKALRPLSQQAERPPVAYDSLTGIRLDRCTLISNRKGSIIDESHVHTFFDFILNPSVVPNLSRLEIVYCARSDREVHNLCETVKNSLTLNKTSRQNHLELKICGVDAEWGCIDFVQQICTNEWGNVRVQFEPNVYILL